MGYQTDYTLHTMPASEAGRIRKIITDFDHGDPFEEACKWYEHEAHVKTASASAPGVIIQVNGQGEEAGDEWVLYCMGGELIKHRRPKWDPPPPPAEWVSVVESSQAERQRKASAEREREVAELRRLRKKYPDAN